MWATSLASAAILFCGPCWRGDCDMAKVVKETDHVSAGLTALKSDQLVKAEHEFIRASDRARLAEVYVRQGRYKDAMIEVDGVEDGQAKLMLALAHQGRGEFGEYRRRLVEAKNLNNEVAVALLAQMDEADCGDRRGS